MKDSLDCECFKLLTKPSINTLQLQLCDGLIAAFYGINTKQHNLLIFEDSPSGLVFVMLLISLLIGAFDSGERFLIGFGHNAYITNTRTKAKRERETLK